MLSLAVPAQAPDELLVALAERLRAQGVWDAHGCGIGVPEERRSIIIGRVADAEPLLSTELSLARWSPARLVRGLAALGLLYRAERLVLAVREDAAILARQLREQASESRLEVVAIPRSWPLDAPSLICDLAQLAGKSVSAAGLERALVVDAVELHDIAVGLEERFPLRRVITVAGAVQEPGVLLAPLGTSFADLVAGCGGCADPGWIVWHNGVLGGRQAPREDVVEVNTCGLVVLPHDHPLVVRETVPLGDRVSRICSACGSCRRCSDICPVHLNGGGLDPHRIMQLVARDWSESALERLGPVLGALECTKCRLCSVVCPARQEPALIVIALAEQLRRQGIVRARADQREHCPHPDRLGRRVAVKRLMPALGLEPYAVSFPTSPRPRSWTPDRITLPLHDPWGRTRVPVVREGARLERGELVLLGAAGSSAVDLRAPVAGTVVAIDPDDGVVIRAR